MDLPKRRILMIFFFFFNAHFNYCPTIWVFYSRSLNTKINRLHERCLRLIYNYEKLLVKDISVSIHHQNIQRLAIQMYIVSNGIFPDIISEIFQLR